MTDDQAKGSIILNLERERDALRETLRDRFAMAAMQSLITCVWERSGDCNHIIDNDGFVSLHLRAYEHADAMMEARKK